MLRPPLRTTLLLLAVSASLLGCDAPSKEKEPGRTPASAQALQAVLPYFEQGWAMNKLWEDGLAEVATYDAERVIYKKKRAFEYTMITVKEEFNQEFNVKTDDYKRADLFPVMKINQFCSIQADQYPYHYLTSLFFRRDQPVALYKMTTSSQEWCGNTFKSIIDDGVNFEMWYHSYWDGEGSNSRDLRRDLFLEDALPYTLRSLKFDQKPAFDLTVLDLQQTNRAKPPVYYQAHLTTTETPATASSPAAWRVAVKLAPDKENTYLFAKEYPNILLSQTTWDGRTLQLKAQRRYAYWPK
ncbi:hypothetical protein Q5H92_15185 [Hymenobacter sp. M29]|uniref:Septum formation inhibitor Maf n=1 Tax=Hymenobacter mellowenesis TaxID=3063995 RepID=A0ABT9AE69_9BACT|nr:hypothetical protein [Hymenobacter sp. M29]MDO7847712.1 hypothetical protein [Hymenobacter sp. M29]